MQLSVVSAANLKPVLALNEAAVPHVSSIDREQMRWFADNAFYSRIATIWRRNCE